MLKKEGKRVYIYSGISGRKRNNNIPLLFVPVKENFFILYQKFDTCKLKLNSHLPKVKTVSPKNIACIPTVCPCKRLFRTLGVKVYACVPKRRKSPLNANTAAYTKCSFFIYRLFFPCGCFGKILGFSRGRKQRFCTPTGCTNRLSVKINRCRSPVNKFLVLALICDNVNADNNTKVSPALVLPAAVVSVFLKKCKFAILCQVAKIVSLYFLKNCIFL